MQDVFLVVHRRRAELRVEQTGRGLLSGIALRVARDARRSLQRRNVGEAVEPPGPTPTPAEDLERKQGAERALKLLDVLDAEKREVFVLAELEGHTAPEIASVLEVNVNTVYSRLRAARALVEHAVEARAREEASP